MLRSLVWQFVFLCCVVASGPQAWGQAAINDAALADYFRLETQQLADACLADFQTLEQWQAERDELRRQLHEMLGLDPLPPKTDLHATVTGRVERDGVIVENIHFQSRPQLYVTGNLYRPAQAAERLPAILYVCGHGGVKKDGISYGNKVHYQHHGAWFARHGYVCLTIDSLQLGEIEGIHHGTHRYDMWWWLNRGYSPAGVEAWNCIRALDYLQSRPEVDGSRLGVTGRSGGGAYSWWIAALDERIRAAVPVAGITDLENHVVDGCVEGHCDCMFMVNTYQWDYAQVAALVAPRPLLISNSDRDGIFPLEGVVRTHRLTRRIYDLYRAQPQLALQITAGPHQDTQELRVHAFRWFQEHLKGDKEQIDSRTAALFTPEELRVFAQGLPADAVNERIAETFVPVAESFQPPVDAAQWQAQSDAWRTQLREKVFRAWPRDVPDAAPRLVAAHEHDGVTVEHHEFSSQPGVDLPLFVVRAQQLGPAPQVRLRVMGESDWAELPSADGQPLWQRVAASCGEAVQKDANQVHLVFAPRGVGPTAWNADKKPQVQNQRRFYLLGQTLDGQRVWDVTQAIRAARHLLGLANARPTITGRGASAAVAVYAALFVDGVAGLELVELPESHREGPYLLNVDRVLTLPAAVALAAERTRIVVRTANPEPWSSVVQTANRLQWPPPQFVLEPLGQ